MTTPFTADVCARAIVAAARSYGDHPVQAITGPRGIRRRSLAAAVRAIADATARPLYDVGLVVGVSAATIKSAEQSPTAKYEGARAAAMAAIGASATVAPKPEEVAPISREAALREAMQRHRAKVSVAGVEKDKAALGKPGLGGCRAHLHLKDFGPACDEATVPGRLFCAEHCRAMGQKDTPVQLAPATMPRPYSDRSL